MLVNRINDFRKELLCMVSKDNNPESVYQINFQVFPLTKLPSKEKNEKS